MNIRWIYECIAAFGGTIAFSLLFHVPRRYYPCCGLIGATGWLIYRIAGTQMSVPAATLWATIAVVFLSRLEAINKACPVTLFLISGIFPLVPGAGIYWTAFYIVTDDLARAGEYGYNTLKTAVAIVFGILFVFEFPQKWFRTLSGRHTEWFIRRK